MENKNSYFSVIIHPNDEITEYQLENLKDDIDLLLGNVKARKPLYEFKNINNRELAIYFETDSRKRRGQIGRSCDRIFGEKINYRVNSYTKPNYHLDIDRIKNNKNYKEMVTINSKLFEEYTGKDIAIFYTDQKNWHSWQREIYTNLFYEDGTIKEPHDRKIISIVDKIGNTGKSSFFKWLYVEHSTLIGRCSYGSASQLRSALVNIGKRKIYIVDLSRSKGFQDKEEDLLAALEELKSGTVFTSMYGSGNELIMEPPHIIVSSNYFLNYNLLSTDRWEVYTINKQYRLEKQTSAQIKKQLVEQQKKVILDSLEKKSLKKMLGQELRVQQSF